MKRLLIASLAAAFLAGGLFARPAFAEVLYEYRETTPLNKSVAYEQVRQMTDAGMLDIHILRVALDDPYTYIGPVDSAKEPGLKETATSLLSGAGAIAGTNADFFGMAGGYSLPFGPISEGNRLKAVSQSINQNANEFAALFIDNYNNPFMRYMKADIRFYNAGQINVNVNNYNKINPVGGPFIVDRQIAKSTAAIDSRHKGLLKVVVESGRITYISQKGETVDIPPDGYVLILPSDMADTYRYRFNVGETADLVITNNLGINFSYIKSSIGGGGLILSGGQTVHDKGTAPSGRHPRTAVGVTRDKKMLILMTVDGRTHSIGATHDEMAALLLRYGAYDAMHFDGGGSSTMVIQSPESGEYEVVNTLSEGAQRRIINALGVFDRSPVGDMKWLGLTLPQQHTFVGAPVEMDVHGLDAYDHHLALPDNARVTFSGEGGIWEDATFIPQKAGAQVIEAQYNGKTAQQTLYVYEIAELQCETRTVRVFPDTETALSFTGIARGGESVPADNAVSVKVNPPRLGEFANGVFTAKQSGTGYLECEVNGVFTYLPVSVGGQATALNAFEGAARISFIGYPDAVTGAVTRGMSQNRTEWQMDYRFNRSNDTQAAYLSFDTPYVIPGDPAALRMNVYGDGSGNWLRGRIRDAEGRQHLIDFAYAVDFTGWQSVTATIPEDARAPLTLERIYLAAVSSETEQYGTLYFSGLEALYIPYSTEPVPEGQRFTDPLRKDLSRTPENQTLNLTVAERMAYSVRNEGKTTILTMTAAGGGLRAADSSQWRRFTADMENAWPEYLIIILDESPDRFSQPKEAELFHKALARQSEHRTVLVVSASFDAADCEIRDGVRYINLQKPFDGTGARIRFAVGEDGIAFDMNP